MDQITKKKFKKLKTKMNEEFEKMNKKDKKMKKKIQNLKFEIDEMNSFIENLDSNVKHLVSKEINKKVLKTIKKTSRQYFDGVKLELLTKMENHYFDFLNKIVEKEISEIILKQAKKKIKTIHLEKNTSLSEKSLLELLNKGWSVSFFGSLPLTGSNESGKMIILEKYKLSKKKKGSKKRKPKRNPKK